MKLTTEDVLMEFKKSNIAISRSHRAWRAAKL